MSHCISIFVLKVIIVSRFNTNREHNCRIKKSVFLTDIKLKTREIGSDMPRRLKIARIEGAFTVNYKKEFCEWTCRALEFDLIGTGETKDEAFTELRDNLEEYILDALFSEEHNQEFFHPSDSEEWNRRGKEHYRISIVLEVEIVENIPDTFTDLQELRPYRDRIKNFDFQAAY